MATPEEIDAWIASLPDDVPKRSCGRCKHFTPKNAADPTAGEGRCDFATDPGHWPTGYWPHVLRRDACARGFKKRPQLVTS